MSYQQPYTFDERKQSRTLKYELVKLFSTANDDEIQEWLIGYRTSEKDIIRLLRTLIDPNF